MKTRNIIITIVAVAIVLAVLLTGVGRIQKPETTGTATDTGATSTGQQSGPMATVSYVCAAGKTIQAAYYEGQSSVSTTTGQPIPGGKVDLTLSDGRSLTLPQTISADGTRYANADESVIFWSKGNGAFVQESNKETFTGCVQVANDPGGLPQAFVNTTDGFSIRIPADYKVDSAYKYQALGPGKDIAGVKFTIPASAAKGTNLGSDSYISVEQLPKAAAGSCTADRFLDSGNGISKRTVTENGTTYSVASTTGAGAGNRYDETVYALDGTQPCTAIRYFIHYSVIENYPAGTVKQFDEAALKAQFDGIRRTLMMNQ